MPECARFVSVARFAELVGLSERTCWNLIRVRVLPVYRVGRRTLVKVEEGLKKVEQLGEAQAEAQRREDV